ncbi:MAG: 4'-phosphopantetheinyl transferase family protein [Methylobacter sp.]
MNANAIQLWHGNIAADDRDYQNYWRVLDEAERAHAGRMKNDLLHKRYVEVHGRLRSILAQALDQAPERIAIKKTGHGKPYLADRPELAFNLSHSADTMVLALGLNCRLGVDIEYCKSRGSLAGLVDKCFAGEEIEYWHKLPETQKTIEFYRFWTRKEAFVKAIGLGIGLGLNRCVINPVNPAEFLRVPDDCGPAAIWHVRDLGLNQTVCTALVTDKTCVEISLNAW